MVKGKTHVSWGTHHAPSSPPLPSSLAGFFFVLQCFHNYFICSTLTDPNTDDFSTFHFITYIQSYITFLRFLPLYIHYTSLPDPGTFFTVPINLTLKASARISAPLWLVRLERPTKNSRPEKINKSVKLNLMSLWIGIRACRGKLYAAAFNK